MKIKVSKRTIDNFLIVWNELSDTGPSDWEDNIQLNTDKYHSEECENIHNFIQQLSKYAGPDCLYCGSSRYFCGCEKL